MNGYLQVILLVVLVQLASSDHVHNVEKELELQGMQPGIPNTERQSRQTEPEQPENPKKPIAEQRVLTFMVSGRNLDAENKINPRLTLFYQTQDSDLNSQESSRIYANANPDWPTIFTYKWIKGSGQKWEFKVKGTDQGVHKDKEELPLGHVEVDVDTYVENKENIMVDLEGNNNRGQLIIEKTIPFTFKLGAKNLATLDNFYGKSDPYVKCYWRRGPDGVDVYISKTAVVNNVVDVEWMEIFTFKGYQRGTDQYLHFQLYDEDGMSKDDPLGEAFLRLDSLDMSSTDMYVKVLDLMNEGKRNGRRGSLVVKIFPSNSLASKTRGRVDFDVDDKE